LGSSITDEGGRMINIPTNRVCILRFFDEEIFHAYVDGRHDCFTCGNDFIRVKRDLQEDHPNRKIVFIHIGNRNKKGNS
jgi:uncharacterized protein (DUF488 family)